MNTEPRTQRKVVSFSASEWKAVDDWMDANRVRVEAEAIRRLIQLGLQAEPRDGGSPDEAALPSKPPAGPA